jgi:uncharacterized protein YprB with RNaseH-like and TPR domain
MKGGLKEIEAKLGLRRKEDVADLTGYDATVLWAKYLRGDRAAHRVDDIYNFSCK